MSALESVKGFEQEVDLNATVAELNKPQGDAKFSVLDMRSSSPLVDVNLLFYTVQQQILKVKKALQQLQLI
ncbi:hypothetical protein [Pseudoalteromonas piratica]|uniref:hypothetical protein n=1 Tax=Pseudoalteromonas piratica TaxID=1348114 RepID=UPI000B118AAA|nr:hypothetical protein [Pseudoalteromonas piratica]